ncbi:NifS-like aminotransferase class-V [Prochlorococcus marinus str. MIT 9313]|uniref:cysteine desulfurase n=2 Tax=Prochlorococcus marinus TaxID=1219 RepID=Q7V4B5_PROMM|nr:NifS-like aminotransferase class-V [Prochlorococcus marinus str. MIT 9313]
MLPSLSSGSLKQSPLCLDYQATTPCAAEVVKAMAAYWSEDWGNASSRQHRSGLKAAAAVSLAREQLACHLRVTPQRVIFTSGATEANNLALVGHARARAEQRGAPGHLITLVTEHHAVLDPLRQLQKEGFRLTELQPRADGLLRPEQLAEAFENDTLLVSVMVANNETGVIQPLAELSELCRKRDVVLHSDAAQAFGHVHLDADALGLDLVSISGHKLYGPKGIGALVVRPEVPIKPLQWGGGQEQGLRPGTLPVPLIVGLAKAVELAMEDITSRQDKLCTLRNQLWDGLRERLPDLILNGSLEHRLPHNLNITIPGVRGSNLHQQLRPLIACSSGSACSQGAPSHVLMALGRTSAEAEASIRLSLGRNTSSEEITQAVESISNVVTDLRAR